MHNLSVQVLATHHRKCMGKFLGGHISLICSWIEALFTLTIPVFEGLHDDI